MEIIEHEQQLDKIKRTMQTCCHQPQSIQQLCEKIEVPYHIAWRLFRRFEGCSPYAYFQRLRQKKAEDLLSDPDNLVFEVAFALEFTNEANFTNWFKKRTALTPSDYKATILKIA